MRKNNAQHLKDSSERLQASGVGIAPHFTTRQNADKPLLRWGRVRELLDRTGDLKDACPACPR